MKQVGYLALALGLFLGAGTLAASVPPYPFVPKPCEWGLGGLSPSSDARGLLAHYAFHPAMQKAAGMRFNGGRPFDLASYFSLLNHPTEGRSFRFEARAVQVIAGEEKENVLGLGDKSVQEVITEGYTPKQAKAIMRSGLADMLSYVIGRDGQPSFRIREMKSFELGRSRIGHAIKQLKLTFRFLIARFPDVRIDRAEIVVPSLPPGDLQKLIATGKLMRDPSDGPNVYRIQAENRLLEHQFGQRVEIKVHFVPFPE